MTQGRYTLTGRAPLAREVWQLRLAGDTSAITAPRPVLKNPPVRVISAPSPLGLRLGR